TEKHRPLVMQLARIFAAATYVRAIFLGGSLARERGHPTSDVDLGIVVPPSRMAEFIAREPERTPLYRALGADLIEPEPDGATLGFAETPAHLWYLDGDVRPGSSGVLRDDPFELAIAQLVYGRTLLER